MPSIISSPRNYQEDAAAFLISQQSALLHADMGMGKSLSSILAFLHLLDALPNSHCLVITPKPVAKNFLADIKKHFKGFSTHLHLGPNRNHNFTTPHITISTYDLLHELSSHNFNCCILDEAHLLRNPKALRHKRTLNLVDNIDFIWALSGTPLVNSFKDIHALQNLLGITDIHSHTLRLHKAMHLPDLPPIHSHLYQLDAPHLSTLKLKLKDPGCILPKITNLRKLSASLPQKLQLVKDIHSANPTHNILVFSNFKDGLLTLNHDLGDCTLLATGDLSLAQRCANIHTYQSNSGKILLATYQALGLGVNLTNTHHIILLDPAWNHANHQQAVDRAHRLGLLHPLHLHIPFSPHSLDTWLENLIKHKKSLADGLIEARPSLQTFI